MRRGGQYLKFPAYTAGVASCGSAARCALVYCYLYLLIRKAVNLRRHRPPSGAAGADARIYADGVAAPGHRPDA